MAARRPSSPRPGGMLTSAITTDGRWARPLRSRSFASPAWATTSNPASVSRRAIPSRRSTSSSPMTTRSGSGMGLPYRATGVASLAGAEELAQRCAREIGFPYERACAGLAGLIGGRDVVVDRGENDARAPWQGRELPREGDPVSVGELDVEEDCRGHQPRGGLTRHRNAVGLADHAQAAGREQAARQLAEPRVVVDDE